jgi:hypothetical protein
MERQRGETNASLHTVEAANGSLLRDNEIGEEHEEDASDEADVEVDQRPALHALLPGFSPRSSSLQAPSFCGAACYYSEQEGSSVRFCLLHSSAIGYHFFSKIDASGIGPGASFGGVTLTLQGLGSVIE